MTCRGRTRKRVRAERQIKPQSGVGVRNTPTLLRHRFDTAWNTGRY